ncbi:MAG: hypothetical protein HYT11_02070 [Candidatus Levybacteria bacterium]|nr:hypothetical protein [Candidatus Levybacteria bacterium]
MADKKKQSTSFHYKRLKRKWVAHHRKLQKSLWEKHGSSLAWLAEKFPKHQLAAGSLGTLLMLSAPVQAALPKPELLLVKQVEERENKTTTLKESLVSVLPSPVRSLTPDEETRIGQILSESFGFRVTSELDGKKLNRSYGIIGAEQHLARYPGDSMATHFSSPEESALYYSSGMAPGLGAWRYFATSQTQMTPVDVAREKYYIAVQTFLVPDYNQRVAEYTNFFRYRKMLVVNPENGKAIVAVIGDAGPAEWTGKHLGGSPEVMKHLERVDGTAKGPVIYFFIDDPEDKVPLGPMELK